MSTPLEQAEAEVARLKKQAKLEQAVADAGAAYEADPSEKNLAAHNKASEALAEHRTSNRTEGVQVGGDAYVEGGEVEQAEPAPEGGVE